MSCLALKMTQLALAAFTFEVRDSSLDVVFATGDHGVDEAGDLVGGGFNGTRAVEASQTYAVARADEAAAATCGARGQAQRLSRAIEPSRRLPAQRSTSADTGHWRQGEPRAEVLAGGEARQGHSRIAVSRQSQFCPRSSPDPSRFRTYIPAACAHPADRPSLRRRTVPQHPLDLRVTAIAGDFGRAQPPDHIPASLPIPMERPSPAPGRTTHVHLATSAHVGLLLIVNPSSEECRLSALGSQ